MFRFCTLVVSITLTAAATLAAEPGPLTFESRPIGDPWKEKATIANLCIVDLDQDGRQDVLVCDVAGSRVSWIRQDANGEFRERQIGEAIPGAANVEAFDIDQDGDLDVLVACMTQILPNNDQVGKVIVLENTGDGDFRTRILAEDIIRVTDVQAGDLDGDGDIDLAVGQFGYDQGEIRWMENKGDWEFESHVFFHLSGTIHAPIADMDGDGDLDIVALVSQEWESVYCFENDGEGNFKTKLLHDVADSGFGSSGIDLCDLDEDGDVDVIWTNGDAFVTTDYVPVPNQGVQWLENKGDLNVEFHRVGEFAGAYGPVGDDLDGDGDKDILLVSAFNHWDLPGAYSLMWWENLGEERFRGHHLAREPTHQLTADVADIDGDGDLDAVTGCMFLNPPYDRPGRITLWLNQAVESAQEQQAEVESTGKAEEEQ